MKKVSVILAAMLLFASASVSMAADYVMKISHPAPVSDQADDHVAALFLKSFVESNSNGRIEVQIFPANQLGSFQDVMQQLQVGTLEVADISSGGFTSFAPELQVLDLPYLFRNDAVAEEFMRGRFIERMRGKIMEHMDNALLVCASNSGSWRSFLTTDKLITSADDLKGVKIRTISSPLQQQFVKELGGVPVAVPWGEVYTGLASGLVSGTKNALFDIMVNKFDEYIKNATLDKHAYLFGFWFVSNSWLNSLPEDLQNIVVSGISQAGVVQTMFNKRIDAGSVATFTANGGKVHMLTDSERQTFLKAKQAMIDWYVNKYGTTWYDYLSEDLAAAEKAVADSEGRVLNR